MPDADADRRGAMRHAVGGDLGDRQHDVIELLFVERITDDRRPQRGTQPAEFRGVGESQILSRARTLQWSSAAGLAWMPVEMRTSMPTQTWLLRSATAAAPVWF